MKRFAVSCLFLVYDLLFVLTLVFYLPFHFLRKKITLFSLKEKLGFFSSYFKKSIWIHAVSVGEANLIEPVIKKIADSLDCPIVISTTTLTGSIVAKKKYSEIAKIIYFPFDLSCVLKRFFRKINPSIFVAVETELWPNLIRHLNKNNIPFVIINGRISNQAFRRYKLVRFLMKKVLSGCTHIGVQNEKYRKRFIYLGADSDKISVTGNLKFNMVSPDLEKIEKYEKNFSFLIKPKFKKLIIAASTHHPEEDLVLDIYKNICSKQKVSLLLAPRHPQRASFLESLIAGKGFNPVLISQLSSSDAGIKQPAKNDKNVFILDTVGELIYFYNMADICFVGGSFSSVGGHNILEPMYFSKPVIFGPNMDNFTDIVEVVLDYSAAIQVNSFDQLEKEFLLLLSNKEKRCAYSKASASVFQKNNNIKDNLEIILKEINN